MCFGTRSALLGGRGHIAGRANAARIRSDSPRKTRPPRRDTLRGSSVTIHPCFLTVTTICTFSAFGASGLELRGGEVDSGVEARDSAGDQGGAEGLQPRPGYLQRRAGGSSAGLSIGAGAQEVVEPIERIVRRREFALDRMKPLDGGRGIGRGARRQVRTCPARQLGAQALQLGLAPAYGLEQLLAFLRRRIGARGGARYIATAQLVTKRHLEARVFLHPLQQSGQLNLSAGKERCVSRGEGQLDRLFLLGRLLSAEAGKGNERAGEIRRGPGGLQRGGGDRLEHDRPERTDSSLVEIAVGDMTLMHGDFERHGDRPDRVAKHRKHSIEVQTPEDAGNG